MKNTLLRDLISVPSFLIAFLPLGLFSQVLYSDGGTIMVTNGGNIFCNGGMSISNSGQLTNNGNIETTKNSTLSQAGNFELKLNANAAGNGIYRVEQDWINDATFNGGSSEVILFGNTEQFITSTNATVTTFNNLTLTGNGTAVNRRKTLLNVSAATGVNGILNLNDRELNTDVNTFTVNNMSPSSISNSLNFNDEGLVSSLTNGFLIREMNQSSNYLFPVGSSNGTRRYRPVEITPNSSSPESYAVRMNNYSADNDNYYLAQHESTIDLVNDQFYHSIHKINGNSNPAIKIFYVPSVDNDWISFGHWYDSDQLWKDVNNTTDQTVNDFKYIQKIDWTFPTNSDQYVLINTSYPIDIPNVFTPNADGVNDFYFITSKGLTDYSLIILNRWGELVFETEDPNQAWDGKFKGNECTEGVYFYRLNAKQQGNKIVKHGHVTLTR